MNSLDLFSFLINDDECRKYFLGIFARDELPSKLQKFPTCFIINTQTRSNPGLHWLAFFIDDQKKVEFFDPFGFHPNYYGLSNYLDKLSSVWTYNHKQIQDHFSNYCGNICLFYLYFRCRNFSMNYILNNFSKDLKRNEKIIFDFLNFK